MSLSIPNSCFEWRAPKVRVWRRVRTQVLRRMPCVLRVVLEPVACRSADLQLILCAIIVGIRLLGSVYEHHIVLSFDQKAQTEIPQLRVSALTTNIVYAHGSPHTVAPHC